MSSDSQNEEGAKNNMASTARSSQETQGVDLSEHTNHTAATRMERAQAQWTKLFAEGVRMATRSFDQFRRPILSQASNARENEPWGDPITEKIPNITRVYCINLNGITLDSRGGNLIPYVVAAKKSKLTSFVDRNTNWILCNTQCAPYCLKQLVNTGNEIESCLETRPSSLARRVNQVGHWYSQQLSY